MMPSYRFPVFICLLSLTLTTCKSVREKRINTYENLTDLKKDGLILVRLKQSINKLEALEAGRESDWADKVEGQVVSRQARLLTMFREQFSFCPVYFFFADESGKVRDGKWSEVVFLDVDGDYVDGDTLYGRPYFVAEFGRVYETQVTGENAEGEERFTTGMAGKDGLVLKDSNFVQLEAPYPYKFFHWKPENAVAGMNRSLYEFLRKQESKGYMLDYLLEKERSGQD